MKNRKLIFKDCLVLLFALIIIAGCTERTRVDQELVLPGDDAGMDAFMGDSGSEDQSFDEGSDTDLDTGVDNGVDWGSMTDQWSEDHNQPDVEEEDCSGPSVESDCEELASVEINNPVITYDGGDSTWQAGEELVIQLAYLTTGEGVGYPSISPSTDHPLAVITYFSPTDLFVLGPESAWEPVVKIHADSSISPGTDIRITVAASLQWGEVVACDCPDYDVDSWSYTITVQ
jgi:hypothetical protein